MDGMRRLASLCLAAGYSVSFLAVCLVACLSPATGQDHSCCTAGQGIRAMDTDCCSVVAGVNHGGTDVTPASPAAVAPAETAPPSVPVLLAWARSVRAAASPPLILRI